MLVIVTGTINPDSNVPFLTLTDKNTRYNQYIDCIKKLFESDVITKIIFCENSNTKVNLKEIEYLAQKKKKQFEFLQFKGDIDKVIHNGKGYGEGEILEYVISNSKLVYGEEYFFKLTGRLSVDNIDKIIRKTDKRYNYFNSYIGDKCKMVDTRFYGIRLDNYNNYLKEVYKKVSDKNGFYLEHAFYKAIVESNIKTKNLAIFPRVSGQSGSTGKIYIYDNRKYAIKDILSKFNFFGVR